MRSRAGSGWCGPAPAPRRRGARGRTPASPPAPGAPGAGPLPAPSPAAWRLPQLGQRGGSPRSGPRARQLSSRVAGSRMWHSVATARSGSRSQTRTEPSAPALISRPVVVERHVVERVGVPVDHRRAVARRASSTPAAARPGSPWRPAAPSGLNATARVGVTPWRDRPGPAVGQAPQPHAAIGAGGGQDRAVRCERRVEWPARRSRPGCAAGSPGRPDPTPRRGRPTAARPAIARPG